MAGNPCYSLLWLILLVFIAWPLAYFCAGLWIFLMVRLAWGMLVFTIHVFPDLTVSDTSLSIQYDVHIHLVIVHTHYHFHQHKKVFEECLPAFKDCSTFLEKFVTWPRDCGRAIVKCESNCPQP
jgi:hypothetical protein